MNEQILFPLVMILVLGIMAQWISWKLRISTIILFVLFGVIAGPITGMIQPDLIFGDLLMPLVSLAVAIILFEGGLTLDLKELRTIGKTVNLLISVGMLITWVITSLAAYYILGFELKFALLLGSLLVVTGPTVIVPLLRQMRLGGKTGSILKWEGILIDPIGALLALLVFQALFVSEAYNGLIPALLNFSRSLLVGGALGFLGGYLLVVLLKKRQIPEHLQSSVTLVIVLGTFAISNLLQPESGLLVVTVMGITLANQKKVNIKKIIEFKETLGAIILASVFIILTARLSIADLMTIGSKEFIFLLVLIFGARPITVFISSIGGGLQLKEKILLSFIAPRGVVAVAVSSVFALRLSDQYPAQAASIVPIIFFIVIGTVLFYSILAPLLARFLGLVQPHPQGILVLGAHDWGRKIGLALKNAGFEVTMVDSNPTEIKKAQELGLTAIQGNILSNDFEERIDINSLGNFLAITCNDEINSLAALKFSDFIGIDNTYQLPLRTDYEVPIDLRGRILFCNNANFDYLQNKFDSGSEIKEASLKEKIDIKSFNEKYRNEITPLFYKNGNGKLTFITGDNPTVLNSDIKLSLLIKDELNTISEFDENF